MHFFAPRAAAVAAGGGESENSSTDDDIKNSSLSRSNSTTTDSYSRRLVTGGDGFATVTVKGVPRRDWTFEFTYLDHKHILAVSIRERVFQPRRYTFALVYKLSSAHVASLFHSMFVLSPHRPHTT